MIKQSKSEVVSIFMAGDIGQANAVIRRECMRDPICVTLSPCEYIYTGGQESGFVVGLLNYPRFPVEHGKVLARAREMAELLRCELCQHSSLIVAGEITEWTSDRTDKEVVK